MLLALMLSAYRPEHLQPLSSSSQQPHLEPLVQYSEGQGLLCSSRLLHCLKAFLLLYNKEC